MDDPTVSPLPPPIRGVHPLAGLPPVVATVAVSSDLVTAQMAFITGAVGIALAELACRWAHRHADRASAEGRRSPVVPAVLLAGAATAVLAGALALFLAGALSPGYAGGVAAGGRSLLVSGVLLALPLRGTRLRAWWTEVVTAQPRPTHRPRPPVPVQRHGPGTHDHWRAPQR